MAGNMEIAEAGKATQFGAGNDPVAAAKKAAPWSIRNALRNLAAQEIDPDNFESDLNALVRAEGKCTVAKLAAARMMARGIQRAEPLMMEKLIDNIDGKLTQPIDLDPAKEAPTQFASVEEAAAAYAEHIKG